MKIELKNIVPNPFRDLKINPLREDKVVELVDSINDTGFWDNVVVRRSKEKPGTYELAYGHHRLEAARKAGVKEADFIVKKLSDDMMLKIMSRENKETYKNSVLSVIEAVAGCVKALAEGTIAPCKLDPKTRLDTIRIAPSYIPGEEASSSKFDDHPWENPKAYTVLEIGKRLGYTKADGHGSTRASEPVVAALNALWLIQVGRLTTHQIKDWTVSALLSEVNAMTSRVVEERKRAAKTQAEVNKAMQEKIALEAEERARAAKYQKEREELKRKEQEASRKEREDRARELAERCKKRDEEEKQREVEFKVRREAIDTKVEHIKAQAVKAKAEAEKIKLSDLVDAMCRKLHNIATEDCSLREEMKSLERKPLDANQRELVRKAINDVADKYAWWSNDFLPKKPVDVLKEANQKEELKRRVKKENE